MGNGDHEDGRDDYWSQEYTFVETHIPTQKEVEAWLVRRRQQVLYLNYDTALFISFT